MARRAISLTTHGNRKLSELVHGKFGTWSLALQVIGHRKSL
jgi:hypothetical protein